MGRHEKDLQHVGLMRPVLLIGAGGIAADAHLPAYKRLGLPLRGVFDLARPKAESLAGRFGIEKVYSTLSEAAAEPGCVFDLAVPASKQAGILNALPEGAAVLMQKPMGENLAAAREILGICRRRRLKAAVNFQLRFSPNMLAISELLKKGALGKIWDLEFRIVIDQPWGLWAFLKGLPRMEFVYHSIHYLDLIRSFLGEPKGVYAKGARHPDFEGFAEARSSVILDYGDEVRCSLVMNHSHRRGPAKQVSQMMIEGDKGAALAGMGVNLNYPKGEPDTLEVSLGGGGIWNKVPLSGSWFTEAFEGPMMNLQRFISGEDKALVSGVEDAVKTMALVEACYESSAHGATPIPPVELL